MGSGVVGIWSLIEDLVIIHHCKCGLSLHQVRRWNSLEPGERRCLNQHLPWFYDQSPWKPFSNSPSFVAVVPNLLTGWHLCQITPKLFHRISSFRLDVDPPMASWQSNWQLWFKIIKYPLYQSKNHANSFLIQVLQYMTITLQKGAHTHTHTLDYLTLRCVTLHNIT